MNTSDHFVLPVNTSDLFVVPMCTSDHFVLPVNTSDLFVLHMCTSDFVLPHEGPGGLSRECVLRIPSVIVKGD